MTFKRQSLLIVASDSYSTTCPHSKKQRNYLRTMKTLKTQRKKSNLCRDASVPSVPETHTRGRLHLIRGSPWRLVTFSVRAHLQVLMNNIWFRGRKENRKRRRWWEVECDGWSMLVENRAGLDTSWWEQQERKTLSWTLSWALLFLSRSPFFLAEDISYEYMGLGKFEWYIKLVSLAQCHTRRIHK